MTKKDKTVTEKEMKKSTAGAHKEPEKKHVEAKSEGTKKESTKKNEEIKYHYSVNLSSSNPTPAAQKPKPEAAPSASIASEKNIHGKEEKVEVEFIPNTAIKPDAQPQQQATVEPEETIKVATAKRPATAEELKNLLTQGISKDNAKALVKSTSTNALAKMQGSIKGIVKGTDAFINFVVKKEGSDRNDVLQKARSPIVFAIWIGFVTFFVAGIWSGIAPLDSASGAMGVVVPPSKKQIIQHREGGIVEAIYVSEGESVTAGQPLVKITDKVTKAALISYKSQEASLRKQLKLVKEQLSAYDKLFEQGLIKRDAIIQYQSKEAELIANISQIEAKVLEAEDSLNRLVIKSPVNGTVNQIEVHTIGAVLRPSDTVLTITPKDEDLVIDAYVSPQDIDSIYVGLKARVRIDAFKHRSVSPMEGTVTHVSSDVVEPPQGRYSFESSHHQRSGGTLSYKVRIEVEKDQLTKISKYRNYELQPGMTASVMIVTGERTLLQYMLDPITTTFWHAFVEK